MPTLKRGSIMPTAEEDAAIQRGIDADSDTSELSDAEFQKLRPVGRPRQAVTKQAVKLRLDPEVVNGFRAKGKGWQTAINKRCATLWDFDPETLTPRLCPRHETPGRYLPPRHFFRVTRPTSRRPRPACG